MTVTSSHWSHFLHPRHWATWLGLGLLALTALLPASVGLACGRLLGRLLYAVVVKRRRVTLVNLQLCFPELTEQQRQQLAKDSFAANGMGLVETAWAWWRSDAWLRKRVQSDSLEVLQQALQQGNGVILLSGHFSALDLGGRLLSLYLQDFVALYRPHNDPLMEHFIYRGRQHFCEPVDRRQFLTVRKRLKQNKAIWYAPDQDFGAKGAVFAPFFGQTAATITATSRLPALNNSPVVLFVPQRLPDQSYRLSFKLLEGFPCGDELSDASRINQELEQAIRRFPEQYLWMHKRFKTQPDGEQKLYKAARC